MKLKLGKLFLRINSWVSGYDSHKEKKLAVSEDHKPYIRAKTIFLMVIQERDGLKR